MGRMLFLFVACAVLVIPLLAILLGIIALVRINRSGGQLRGRGWAIAAILGGALMLFAVPALLWRFLMPGTSTPAPFPSFESPPSAPVPFGPP
jgi:hypothetical protein